MQQVSIIFKELPYMNMKAKKAKTSMQITQRSKKYSLYRIIDKSW